MVTSVMAEVTELKSFDYWVTLSEYVEALGSGSMCFSCGLDTLIDTPSSREPALLCPTCGAFVGEA